MMILIRFELISEIYEHSIDDISIIICTYTTGEDFVLRIRGT